MCLREVSDEICEKYKEDFSLLNQMENELKNKFWIFSSLNRMENMWD